LKKDGIYSADMGLNNSPEISEKGAGLIKTQEGGKGGQAQNRVADIYNRIGGGGGGVGGGGGGGGGGGLSIGLTAGFLVDFVIPAED